jgi:hypothetical protein
MGSYQDLFSWALVLPDADIGVIENHDGTCFAAFTWEGIPSDMCANRAALNVKYQNYYQFLDELTKHDVVIENHFFRTADSDLAKKYTQYGEENITRAKELGLYFRKQLADHLSNYGRANQILTVVSMPAKSRSFFKNTKQRNKIYSEKDKLKIIIKELTAFLAKTHVLSKVELIESVIGNVNKDRYKHKTFNLRDDLYINQQIIKKPKWNEEKELLCHEHYFTRVLFLVDYPDAQIEWFSILSTFGGIDVEVTQIIKPLNTNAETLKSARQGEKAGEAANSIGGEDVAGKIKDGSNFRAFISENNLSMFGQSYVIKLHHTNAETLKEKSKKIEQDLTRSGITFCANREEIARLYYRVSMMGQGYKTPFFRPDHSLLVGNMAPIIKYSEGDIDTPQMLRLTSQSTIIADSFPENGVHHRLTAAKTGSGKTVYHAAEICELFPLGFNFYIVEVGRGFEWIVDMFGGDYFVLDAEKTVVSPFPCYDLDFKTEKDEEEQEKHSPIPAHIIGATIEAIMPILMGTSDYSKRDDLAHFQSSAEDIFQACYLPCFKGAFDAPTLENYLNVGFKVLNALTSEPKQVAAKIMLDNLDSFLARAEGKIFKKADSIDFNKPIIGIDFSVLLESENNDLAKYMLTFIGMRFRQLAFANENMCFNIFDEYHEFQSIDALLMDKLSRQMTRRGRKKAAYFNPISQAVEDMFKDSEGEGDINQYTHKNLMYYGTEHGDIADIFKLSDNAMNIWKKYRDPLEARFPYRQCLRVKGDKHYDLHLTYPQVFSDLTNSNPKAVSLKEEINLMTSDPFERLTLFRERNDNG